MTLAVISLTVGAGCGGGGDSGSTSTAPTVAKPVYLKRAKAICRKAVKRTLTEGVAKLHALEKSSGKSAKASEQVLISNWLAPTLEGTVEELRAVGVPPGDEDRVNAIYEALEEVIELAKTDPKRYLYEQVNAKHPYREVERLAAAYGIPECGQP